MESETGKRKDEKGKAYVERIGKTKNVEGCDMEEEGGIGEEALPKLDISMLRPEQKRAYELVEWHLEQSLGK